MFYSNFQDTKHIWNFQNEGTFSAQVQSHVPQKQFKFGITYVCVYI